MLPTPPPTTTGSRSRGGLRLSWRSVSSLRDAELVEDERRDERLLLERIVPPRRAAVPAGHVAAEHDRRPRVERPLPGHVLGRLVEEHLAVIERGGHQDRR